MATAGGGMEGAKASAYEGGGVGGKFRKRPFRRPQTTPYDRPAAAGLPNPTWLSKRVLDPASKLISAGAQHFFSSLFRKRLPPSPPSQPPEDRQESINGLPEAVQANQAGPQEPAGNECQNPSSNGISELEKSLKQKAFTRSEIERLTQLLHSRAIDVPVENDNTKIEANDPIQNTKSMSDSARHEQLSIPLEGSEIKRDRAHGDILTPTVGKMVLEDETASPAELAKAYMSSKSSKLSPSKLGLRSQIASEEAILINTSPFTSRSAITSLAIKTTGHVGRQDNGYTAPRSSGRSALYNMSPTPYSRLPSASIKKVSSWTSYGYTRPSPLSLQPGWDNDRQSSSRQMALKRRSSLLDDDIGSVGPIRRIRQKIGPLSHGLSHSTSGMGLGSVATQVRKLPLMDEMKNNPSSRPSYAHVPPKSSEMAARILEHLDRITPKKKSPESNLAAARERSPVKLTPDFHNGQAHKSPENLGSSKLLQSAQGVDKLGRKPIGTSHESHDSVAQNQCKEEENVSVKFVRPFGESTPVVKTNATVPVEGITPSAGSGDAAQASERNQSFKISAQEDSFELENGGQSSKFASKFFDKEQGRSHSLPVSSKGAELEERHTGFAFSWAHVSNTRSQKTSGKVPSSMDSSAESLIRASVSAGDTDASVKVLESDKSGTESFQQDSSVNGNSGAVLSLASSTVNIVSSGSHSNDLVSCNGLPVSSMSTLSGSTAAASDKLADQNFSNISNHLASSSSATTISTSNFGVSNGGLSITNVAPSISTASIINLGSSVIPSTAASETSIFSCLPASSDSQGSLTGSRSAVGTKLSPSGSGSSPFSQSMSVQSWSNPSPMAFGSSSSQSFTSSSIFGSSPATTLSVLGSSSSGTSSSTTDTGFIISSSGERSTKFSGVTFPSSVTPAVVSFGVSPAPSTAEFKVVASGSTAPVTFSFAAKSAPSPSEPYAVTSGSGAVPATFSSGAETSPSSSSLGAPAVFSFSGSSATSGSSTTPSMSSFGASSTSLSATSCSSTTPSMFSFGASSSSSSATSGSSTAPSFFSFGASSASSSPASSSSTTPMFSFGASSLPSTANGFTSSVSTAPSIFSFGANASTLSSGANSVSGANSSFTPAFGSTFNASSLSGFSYGASSSSFGSSNSAPTTGLITSASSSQILPLTPSVATSSCLSSGVQTAFGTPTPFAVPPANNDQMNTEDSMAEDPVQSSTPAAPAFGQSPVSPSPRGFMFGSIVPPPTVPFQFGSQQNQVAPQNTSQFQASSSLGFGAGGSFSLGAGGSFSLGSSGPDKSGRKIVKVNRNRNRKR